MDTAAGKLGGDDSWLRVLALECVWGGKAALKLMFERRQRECLWIFVHSVREPIGVHPYCGTQMDQKSNTQRAEHSGKQVTHTQVRVTVCTSPALVLSVRGYF